MGAGGGQYYAGTAGNDTITGTAFADEILAGSGDADLAFLIDDEPITRSQFELAFRAGMEGVEEEM